MLTLRYETALLVVRRVGGGGGGGHISPRLRGADWYT
jgi:hypothetical protein